MKDFKELINDQEIATTFGTACWLMSQIDNYKYVFLKDLEQTLITAIKLKQCQIFRNKGKAIGCFLWAQVNDQVNERLENHIIKLKPSEWNSGNNLWIIDIINPFDPLITQKMIDYAKQMFINKKFKIPSVDDNGNLKILLLEGDNKIV